MASKNKVPDRWEKYTDMGRIIPGTRFIAFKVPLRQEIMQKVNNASWFCPRTLIDHCHNLGLVIDLTDTFRYYSAEEFENRGVTHLKIRVKGRKLPEDKAVQKFFQAVNKFLEKNKENDRVIGVHCTHGLNRSGYLVCRYMIQVLGIPPDQAITDFNSARGHEMERENYLSDLRQAPWMHEVVPKYIRTNSGVSDGGSETPNASLLDSSSVSLDTTNNTSVENSASEVESPGITGTGGISWNLPLLKYPAPTDNETVSLPPLRRWSRSPPLDKEEAKRIARRRRRYNPLESPEEPQHKRHQVRHSPYEARSYYDQSYQGRVAPQYDCHFYQRQGSGVGPHRPMPRHHRQHYGQGQGQGQGQGHGPNNAPRQYRGPRPYRSPPPAYPTTPAGPQEAHSSFRTPDQSRTPHLRSYGPIRNAMSPGFRDDVFSPFTPRRSARMTPY